MDIGVCGGEAEGGKLGFSSSREQVNPQITKLCPKVQQTCSVVAETGKQSHRIPFVWECQGTAAQWGVMALEPSGPRKLAGLIDQTSLID